MAFSFWNNLHYFWKGAKMPIQWVITLNKDQ
ncbi:hypothetical protein SAMN05421736_11552 [Evansella caseinilytica]|uniref:Uncharacterized protein n=1 Tax=Evansella caseinilytica TaxID=1503961 RepID=A0A1H3TKL6_9BACI|nr:hypothetical protein SAMN05421736_11552 [Evansella caseinilytica]